MNKIMLAAAFIATSTTAVAETNVIYDNDSVSKPLDKYERVFTKTESVRSLNKKMMQHFSGKSPFPSQSPNEKKSLEIVKEMKKASKTWLPIRTPEITFGEIEDREVYFPNVGRPFCVIGNDNNSMKWVDEHFEYLKKIDAYCWLINVDSNKDFKRIHKHTAGLQVVPAQGTILHELFELSHYPVLVTSRKVMQ